MFDAFAEPPYIDTPRYTFAMDRKPDEEYLTIEEASEHLGVTPGYLRRVLREHGLGEFMRASLGRGILIRKSDLANLRTQGRRLRGRRGAA